MAASKDKNSQEEKPEEVTPDTEEIQAEQTDTDPGSDSDDTKKSSKPDSKVLKFIKSILPSVGIAFGSFLLVFLLHFLGAFNTLELKLYDFRLKLRGPSSGVESNSALPQAEGFVDLTEPFNDTNQNGIWDDSEIFTDTNGNNRFDVGEPFIDSGNGVWDEGEPYVDLDGNGAFDEWDEFEDKGNGKWDAAEKYTDINNNRIWDSENNLYDAGIDSLNSEGVGCWVEESCANGIYDPDEDFTDSGNGKWDGAEPFEDKNNNGIWDDAEPFRDDNGDGKWNVPEPIMDNNGNGNWDDSEVYTDINGNGVWDIAEEFSDDNENGIWDEGEELFDIGNDVWDEGEEFVDIDECEKTGEVCHNQECVEYKECHDINQNGKWDAGLDVVIVERDDESFRLIPDPLPYSRANVWARVIRNLTDAGAKVIVFDFVFDKPDHQTKNLKSYMETNELEFLLIDGDEKFIEAVQYAEANGAKVILASKIAYEASRIPPTYYSPPYEELMNNDLVNITSGLVNIPSDADGFNRRYWPLSMAPGDTNLYPTLAIQTVIEYLGISKTKPIFEGETTRYGPFGNNAYLNIPAYGSKGEGFLINFFGPPSGASSPGNSPFNTFNRVSLSNVLDTKDYYLGEGVWDPDFGEMVYFEDQDWMDKYIDPFMAPIFEAQGFINPFKGKIVLIGTSMAEDQDFILAPYSNYDGEEFQFPGVEFHANAVQHLLNQDFIQTPMGTLNYNARFLKIHLGLIAILIIATLALITKTPPLWGFLIMAVELIAWLSYSVGAYLTDSFWIFKQIAGYELNVPGIGESVMLPVLFPAAAIILPYGINLTYKLFTEGQDKAFLKAAFGNYISPELIDEMFDSKSKPELGGNAAMRTAYFTDIASFSTFSELLTASDLVTLLNEYMTAMTDILLNYGGTLDKYEGDAIIAFFGAPVDQPDNALLALKAGVEMQGACEMLRQKWVDEGDKWPEVVKQMRTRIGINHGDLVCGNMGSEGRMNYTMIGDTVNTASRLEEGAKQYGIYLATTIETMEAAGKDEFEWRVVDKTRYMGKSEATTTVEILGFKGKVSDDLMKAIEIFNEGFELYQQMDWDGAIGKFTESEKYEEEFVGRPNTPSRQLIDRCNEYKEESPVTGDEEWDGVFTMTKK